MYDCFFKIFKEEDEITCIALSPDDKHLITAHRNLLIKQWDNWREWPARQLSHDSTESLNESREVNLEDKLVRCSGLLHAMLMNKIIN